jgi:hypothetical protein
MESLKELGASVGLPPPAVPFMVATLTCPLLGALHARFFSGAGVRNAASLALGLALSQSVYDAESTARLLLPTAAAYLLMACSRRHAGPLVFVVTFAYLIHWCAGPGRTRTPADSQAKLRPLTHRPSRVTPACRCAR